MELINISRSWKAAASIYEVSSEHNDATAIKNILHEAGSWCSRKNRAAAPEYVILDFKKSITINFIELTPSPAGSANFPRDFRLEAGSDGSTWSMLHAEHDFRLDTARYRLDLPLTTLRYLKLFISGHHERETAFFSEIGSISAGITGICSINASSCSRHHEPENLMMTGDGGSFWESEIKTLQSREFIQLDLSRPYPVNRIIMGAAAAGFPGTFSVETSPDDSIWYPLIDEKRFVAEPGRMYSWDTGGIQARYIRIDMESTSVDASNFAARIALVDIFSAAATEASSRPQGQTLTHASIFEPGVVRLSRDCEETPGLAVQANDRRLRDATPIFKGIVQLATDTDVDEGLVIQASDVRLKAASDLKPGIVRLAYDRENKAGTAVQGNDSRLMEASEKTFGIVRLCPDGEYIENAVVQGDDSRILKATTESFGICRLAANKGTAVDTVVQANDHRLRDATIMYRGIVELAENGEDAPDVVVQGNDKRLKDASTAAKGIVELADNGEDAPGVVVQGNDKRLKNATTTARGIVELAENGEDALGVVVQGNDKRLKDATTIAKGIVELADNGEDAPDVVVQGNDKRLKDATTIAKGIVELADNGEDAPDVVVQGNDKRLKDATTIAKGIVELADNGEDAPLVVVQGNDKRLKDASTTAKGIVELADNGEDAPLVVVQGNDKRLKDASTTAKGIVELAENGEDAPDVVVQGNDKRLKDASTTAKGIVELAENGEDAPLLAVQGNDKRLKDASTTAKGIVELAENGEDTPGVVVQGNDKRLHYAGTGNPGIVKLAQSGESRQGLAVQADDQRLNDAREPLPHSHEYAPLRHDYNSHAGTIGIRDSREASFTEVTPPSESGAILYAQNESKNSGSIAIAGIAGITTEKNIQSYGVVGHSRHVGVRGQSSGDDQVRGSGVMGISRFGAGGVFASEHAYSLVAEGYGTMEQWDASLKLKGNGEALLVNGKSLFNGPVTLCPAPGAPSAPKAPVNIAELFVVDDAEYVAPGDLLVVSPGGNAVLARSHREFDRSVIGVVSSNPVMIIDNSGAERKVYPVALAGTVLCRIDARVNPVAPGDLIVSASSPGCGMKGSIDSFEKIGTVIGKALDGLNEGIGLIPIFIAPC